MGTFARLRRAVADVARADEPEWRRHRYLLPVFVTAGIWIPGAAAVALDRAASGSARSLATGAGLLGLAAFAAEIRFYRWSRPRPAGDPRGSALVPHRGRRVPKLLLRPPDAEPGDRPVPDGG